MTMTRRIRVISRLFDFESYSNFQAAIKEAVIENNFEMAILGEDLSPIFTAGIGKNVAVMKDVQKGIGKDTISERSIKNDGTGKLTYWSPILVDGVKYFILLVDNENNCTKEEIARLADIIEFAMVVWKYSPVRDVDTELVKALHRGSRRLAYALKEEGGYCENSIGAVFVAEGTEEDNALKAIACYERKTGYPVLKISEGKEIYGIILGRGNAGHNRGIFKCAFCDNMEKAGAREVLYVNCIESIEEAIDAFQMINEARPFMKYIFPNKKSFTKFEIALAGNCLNISLQGGTVKKYYMDLLSVFYNRDDAKGRELLRTLEVFVLDAGMKSVTAAEIMSLHSNTIQYRLKRIKDILGIDILEPTVAPGLIIALALERIEHIIKLS